VQLIIQGVSSFRTAFIGKEEKQVVADMRRAPDVATTAWGIMPWAAVEVTTVGGFHRPPPGRGPV
jgi:hypothetical protein